MWTCKHGCGMQIAGFDNLLEHQNMCSRESSYSSTDREPEDMVVTPEVGLKRDAAQPDAIDKEKGLCETAIQGNLQYIERESAMRLIECKMSLEYLICEVEELDWETRVPQCTPDTQYYSSLRFFVHCLMTQNMFAYTSQGKEWLDTYVERIDASPDVLTKAAACQVLYYHGLRFRDELKSVASVLPALRQQTIDALEELQVKLGSLENWRLYQDEICKTGKSTTFANHAHREHFNVIYKKIKIFSVIYTKPLKRFVKRIKQFYLTVGKQPEFVPKHRTEAGRDSLGLDVKDRPILKELSPVKRKERPVAKRKRPADFKV